MSRSPPSITRSEPRPLLDESLGAAIVGFNRWRKPPPHPQPPGLSCGGAEAVSGPDSRQPVGTSSRQTPSTAMASVMSVSTTSVGARGTPTRPGGSSRRTAGCVLPPRHTASRGAGRHVERPHCGPGARGQPVLAEGRAHHPGGRSRTGSDLVRRWGGSRPQETRVFPPDGWATEPRLLDRSRFGQRWPRCIPIPWREAVAAPIMAPMSRHLSK